MPSMISENESFQDNAGVPIVNGYIYIGNAGRDPKINPKPIYANRDLTIALANPQRTDQNGRSVNKIWIDGRYSLKVENANQAQIIQDLERGETSSSISVNLTNVQGANSITAEAVPAVSAYVDKAVYTLTIATTNTDAVTLDFGAGAKSVTKNNGDDLISGDWVAGTIQQVIYNLTSDRFELLTFSTAEVNLKITELERLNYLSRMVGEPFFLNDHQAGVLPPDNSSTAKYIMLTAGVSGAGGYNEGLLINESISGVAPRIIATAEIAIGPMAGETVYLINTMKAFIRASSVSGSYAADSIGAHNHSTNQLATFSGYGMRQDSDGDAKTEFSSVTGTTGSIETAPIHVTATAYQRIM